MPKRSHPKNALSAMRVRTIREPGKYADGGGLYLIVDPSGAKRWILRTVIQGKRSDIGLGSAMLVTLADARETARRMRLEARAGGNPLASRRQSRQKVISFREAAETVHESYKPGWRNPKHADQWINTLKTYVFPELGDIPVDRIESADVLRVLSPIWLTKPETARRVRQRISSVMDWCKASGRLSAENPVDGVGKGLPRQRDLPKHHKAMPFDDVPRFLEDLARSDIGLSARLAFEFLILTAARTNEVLLMQWEEIDFDAAVWTVPASRMKSARIHRVPLGPRAVDVLRRAQAVASDQDYVFAGARADKPLSNMVFLMALRRMELDITAHGFRSAFRDWAAERTSFSREVCEMALAHTIKDKTEAAYRRGELFEKRRRLMCDWERHLSPTKGKIVRLKA